MKKSLFTILCAAVFLFGSTSCSNSSTGNNTGNRQTTTDNRTDREQKTADSGTCIHLDTREYKKKVYDIDSKTPEYLGDKPAILDFYADWCGPCQRMSPILEEIAQSYAGKINVYKINIDNEPELAEYYRITSIPTLIFIPMEGYAELTTGLLGRSELEKCVENILKP
jgi:thioredoxin